MYSFSQKCTEPDVTKKHLQFKDIFLYLKNSDYGSILKIIGLLDESTKNFTVFVDSP